MTLEKIAYTGPNVGTNFSFNLEVAGETNQFQMTIMPGATVNLVEHLGGIQADPLLGPVNMPTKATITGTGPGMPPQGMTNTTYLFHPNPQEQTFTMNVNVGSVIGPWATFVLTYRCRWRELPVCYDLDWLCRNRFDWTNFSRWLCLGEVQLSDFYTRPEIVTLNQTFEDYRPRLQRISDELALGFTPAGNTFFDLQTFSFDVVMGAGLSISTLQWGRVYTIEDFTETVSDKVESYVIGAHLLLDFEVLELCRRWRELLDCFCRYCRWKNQLPAAATTYYDANVAPHIDALYAQVQPIAMGEGMPASVAPQNPGVNCDKLSYIVSFWAWWCRRCPLVMPGWGPALDPFYTTLFDKRQFLNDILEANNYKLCNPPEKNFCDRWKVILDCLKKLCAEQNNLPQTLRTDIENTFGTFTRNMANFLALPNIAAYLPPGLTNTCELLSKIKAYFDKLCPAGTIPGGRIRRTQIDNYLVIFENALNGFKGRNGDLCASSVTMTKCDEWMPPLNCLSDLCSKKHLFTSALRSAILSGFETVINDLFTIAFKTPPTPPPGATGIDLLCFKIGELVNFFSARCPNGTIDPIVKLRLEAKLATLTAAYNTLLANYPDICGFWVETPQIWCDSWETILECLQRICRRSGSLSYQILDDVAEDFGPTIDVLIWVKDGAEPPYTPQTRTFEEICESLDALLAYFEQLCLVGTLDPVLKIFLDQQLADLQSAYNTLLTNYPGICYEPNHDCEEWIEMLDCMVRLCDRLKINPSDQMAIGTLDLAVTRFGSIISSVYDDVFPAPPTGFSSLRERLCVEVHGLLNWFLEHCVCCGGSPEESTLAMIAERRVVIMGEYRSLVACEAGCGTTSVSLVTGTAPWVVTRVDDLLLTYPRTPHIVTETCGIADPVEGSEWISPHPTACDDIEGHTTFERCFCVCTPGTIRLQMTFWADDRATIYLDNVPEYDSVQGSMPAPETVDLTLNVTAGRHCIRAKVKNDPAYNMAFCATGTITAVTATLLDDECCGDHETPILPCADVPIPCERIIVLPRLMSFLCCGREPDDPIYTHPPYDELMEALGCFEGEIGMILLALGELPDSIPEEGGEFCDRMRRVVRVLIRAYMNFRLLPAWLRYRVDCFYYLLRAKVSDLAETEIDRPLPCFDECEYCTKWLDLLECLCKMCVMRPRIAASHPALATQIEDLLCFEQYLMNNNSPMLFGYMQYNFVSEYSCCEYLIYAFSEVLDRCLCCTEANDTLEEFEESYNWLYGRYQTLQAAFAAAGLAPCETLCQKWRTMFECLVKICLRRNELPQSLRDRFDQLFPTRLLLLHDAFYGVPPTATPFPNTVFGTTCWGFYRLLRSFTWYCTHLYAFTPEQVLALEEHLADFTLGYNTYMNELAAAGVTICAQKTDSCWLLRRLPEQFRTVCGTTPSAAAAPIIALEALLAQVRLDVPSIQAQLRLPLIAYPASAGFCERLDFIASLMGAARARYDQLLPTYRAVVDLFFAIFSTQVDAYAALIPQQLPRETTPMVEYRNQWLDLLDCLCRICDYIWGLTQAERNSIPTIMAFFTGVDPRLITAINDLYLKVWTLSPALNVPIVNDPCADTLCEKIRIVHSFFSIYCLRCNDPAPAVVTGFESLLDPFRAATVALRGAMQKAGRVVCPDENFDNVIVQSEALYLQAAGSHSTDGTRVGVDGSSVGIHLRWALLGVLGDHIPKGNLAKPGTDYYGTNPFNRKDDFVKIYRAPYGPNQRFAVTIDLTSRTPDSIVGSGVDGVIWTFNNVPYDTTFNDAVTTVQIRFPGNSGYNWAVPLDTNQYPGHVLTVRQNYTGVYRVEAIPKLMFAVEVDVANPGASPSVQFEAISRNDDPEAYDPNFTSARLEIVGAANPHRIESESMEYVDFKCIACFPTVIRLETFEDFYAGSKRHFLWKRFGEYGLSLDNNVVYNRLEDPAKYPVDGTWPKYITNSVAAPTMRVRVDNYKDRWIPRTAPQADPVNGIYNRPVEQSLRDAVVKYLTKSAEWTNVEAWTTEYSIMPGDLTAMKISLLELLQLGAQDYHIARMLGLGAIDWQVTDSTKRYIYVAEYEAPEPLEAQRSPNPLAPTVHRYLSLPTGVLDSRLPIAPTLKPVVKGLEPPYTDSEGYTRYGTYRYLRLYRNDLDFDLPVSEQFFNGPVGFSRGLRTRPILFGIRYASMLTENGAEEWSIPDPSNDDSETAGPDYHPYIDKSGVPEVIPIPDLRPRDGEPVPPVYTHRIKRSIEAKRWHRYAIYGINWFGRVTPFPELNKSTKFENVFPVLNTLQPPLNLKVQYLQREDVPLLNAPSENNTSFFQKTRVTFDWNHTHDLAYQFADEVHLYVRSLEPKRLRGKIKTSDLLDGTPAYAWVTTDSYEDFGNKKTETITPDLPAADVPRYLGSLLVTPSNKYEIVEVVRDGANSNYAKFKVKAIMQAGEDGKMESGQPITPLVDELFLVVENITNIDDNNLSVNNWEYLEQHRIKLVKFPPHTETIVTSGRGEDVQIGGLVHAGAAVVQQQGAGVTGLYEVTMNGVALGEYNDHVANPTNLMISFYKGTLRVNDPLDMTKVRSLEVLKIVSTGPDLKLLVFDPEDRMLSGGGASPMWANFHPSYRVYVEWQAKEVINPVTAFEPTAPELSRITYMAAKAADTGRTDNQGRIYRSGATQPAIHLARWVQDLLPPAEPVGPMYASRPDFYGKASYTFDTPIDSGHVPYGLMFYRADEMAILGALYTMDTIKNLIVPNLPEYRADDDFLELRWRDLINTNLDTNGEFKTYGASLFRFPWPDKALEAEYRGPYKDDFKNQKKPSLIADKIREAIRNAFLPLTESYVVFSQIEESATLQTSPKKPVLRAPDGALLSPDDVRFDPYPMIRRTASSDPNFRVRFSDYTLDGASRNVYFYFSREVSSGLAAGEASVVKGPVRLVNTMPPVAPNLTSVRVSPESAVMETKAEVVFQFNPPPEGERIRAIWIYRALDDGDARSIRTMKQLPAITLTEDLSTTMPFEVRDTFSDLPQGESIPYGQPIYYRVVVARRIENENEELELVPSVPSETIMVSVMDTVNPKAPPITVQKNDVMAPAPNETKVLKYTNVVLRWPHKTYNATYRLYKQSPQGQWTLVKTFAPPHTGTEIVYNWSADHPATQENPENPNLMKLVDGIVIYHRFKVVVTNSSGLVSLVDEVKTV